MFLCLFEGENETRLSMEALGDGFFALEVKSTGIGTRYGYRAEGPWEPHNGHRFNKQKLLIDPFALALDSPASLSQTQFSNHAEDPNFSTDSADFVPKSVVLGPPARNQARGSFIRPHERVIYEAHIKGLTQNHPKIPPSIRGTVAALSHPSLIEHLHSLGVTSLELLPLQARLDERHLWQKGLSNYWGYNPVCFGALEPRLCPGGYQELSQTTDELAKAGIEVILDVVFNHSAESDHYGPTISLRGLDNRHYYRLQKDNPELYENQAGTGNVLRCDDETVVEMVLHSLRHMALRGGVSGFRFDLMSVLGRTDAGFSPDAPLLRAIAEDTVLSPLLLIAEPWDIGHDGYQGGRFPKRYSEWNDAYRQTMRSWWRGDQIRLGEFVTRIAGSSDRFVNPARSINYVTAHDGFTLADLTTYNHKHNEANGEDNRDGEDHNLSDNHGHEGIDGDHERKLARLKTQKAILASLYLSKGTPMLAMGAELGHSQGGNNNAYAQDNETTWINWAATDQSLLECAKALGSLRKSLPILGVTQSFEGALLPHHPHKDVQWLMPNGQPIPISHEGEAYWHNDFHSVLGMLIAHEDQDLRLFRHLIIWQRGDDGLRFHLPEARSDQDWQIVFNSSADNIIVRGSSLGDGYIDLTGKQVIIVKETKSIKPRPDGVSDAQLLELAQKASIQTHWHDLEGRHYEVPQQSLKAILTAMGWGCQTRTEAYDSLRRLSETTDRRPYPAYVWAQEAEAFHFEIIARDKKTSGQIPIILKTHNGETLEILAQLGEVVTRLGKDNRSFSAQKVFMPGLKFGRHKIVMIDERPVNLRLSIVPKQAYLSTIKGQNLSLSAQLYALKGRNDAGIGDLGTLAEALNLASDAGFHRLAIQPLHALFAHDRSRISPYFPSHRGFIDPIHGDLNLGQATSSLRLNAKDHVDYHSVWAAKSKALETSISHIQIPPVIEPNLYNYGLHCALSVHFQDDCFTNWPRAYHDINSPETNQFAEQNQDLIHKHIKIQILMDQQLSEAQKGSRCGLMRDLAIGTAPDGAELWINPHLFAKNISLGAPPDPMGPKGQVWGMPPFQPYALNDNGFDEWAFLMQANMRHACALRIDHALGLSRQFWVPNGALGSEGAYVHVDFNALRAEIRLESHFAQCMVVAEDLGTVPEGLRECLQADNMLSYRVLCFEKDGHQTRPPHSYPPLSMACASTHDLAPLKGYWEGIDVEERLAIGQISHDEFIQAQSDRRDDKQSLINALYEAKLWVDAKVPPWSLSLSAAIHSFIARTPCLFVTAQIEDLALEDRPVNLPGTHKERPNWSRRLDHDLQAIFSSHEAQSIIFALKRG